MVVLKFIGVMVLVVLACIGAASVAALVLTVRNKRPPMVEEKEAARQLAEEMRAGWERCPHCGRARSRRKEAAGDAD